MTYNPKNSLEMVSDPFSSTFFVLPPTPCTDERRLWFRRANEILGFLSATEMALKECKDKYEKAFKKDNLRPSTPIKIASSDGRIVVMPSSRLLKTYTDGVDILCRQVFVMLYGSLETYLFELLYRSFPAKGVIEDILDRSIEIIIKKKWDGKFCSISNEFDLGYKSADLESHFRGFEMVFEVKTFKKPLVFLDELAQVRHRIVHASSIIGDGKYIFVDAKIFNSYFTFCAHLTDYIDTLFAKRFGYERVTLDPAGA